MSDNKTVINTKEIDRDELKRYREDFNRTHLSVETAMQRVQLHRDYIAHAARYSHVVGKYLLSTATRKLNNGNGPSVLDIGLSLIHISEPTRQP